LNLSIDLNDRESLLCFCFTMKERHDMDKTKSAVFLSFIYEEETGASLNDDERREFIEMILERIDGI
jgi:hypothetical protein